MIRRRLRGILRTTVAACIAWTVLGLVTGAVLQAGGVPGDYMVFGRPVSSLEIACAIAGAFVGVVNGLAFAAIVLATERGKRFEDLRGWRWAAWGAIATAGPIGLLLQSPLIAAMGGAMGAAGAVGAIWAARRADTGSARLPVGTA